MTLPEFALLVSSTVCNPMHMPLPLLQGLAMQESGMNASATHVNANGSTDYGLFQINSSNFVKLNLDAHTVMDACLNMIAAENVLLSSYNTGTPTNGVTNGYAPRVITMISRAANPSAPSTPVNPANATETYGPPRPAIHLSDQIASFSRPR